MKAPYEQKTENEKIEQNFCNFLHFDDIKLTKHKKVSINGERGVLEGLYNNSGAKSISSPIVLLLHPQPNSNGSMYNKVIQEAMVIFAKMGFVVLTINFGGVGNSIGKIENGIGEFFDASSAFKWLCDLHPYARYRWLFGFSFGAYIAAQLTMRRPEIDNFVFLSTPINIYDFMFFSPIPTKGLVIHSGGDKIITEKSMLTFFAKNDRGLNVLYSRSEENISHFYTGINVKDVLAKPIYKFAKYEIDVANFRIISDFEDADSDNLKLLTYEQYLDVSGLRDDSECIIDTSKISDDILIREDEDDLESEDIFS